MDLEARTDLLCDVPMADPLGPDSFDQFDWVEVKQEMPDSIEMDKITFTELPFKNCKEIEKSKEDFSLKAPNSSNNEPTEDISAENMCTTDAVKDVKQDNLSLNICSQLLQIDNYKVKQKSKNMSITCELCGDQLSSRKSLKLHKLKKHGQKGLFKCVVCGANFDLLRALLQHCNSEHRQSDGRFSCEVCSRRYSDYNCFISHFKAHINQCKEGESEYNCRASNKAFKDNENLDEYENSARRVKKPEVRDKLKQQEKNFICDFCGKGFTFYCLLRDHVNLHTGLKPHLCLECGKAFSLKSTLKQHSKTHSDVRPYQCSECTLGFFTRGDLRKHTRKHTGERPYVCEVCSERFSRSTHLIVHRRLHTGERPFPCEECGRAFTKRGDLVRHLRVHTGEMPYLCQVCGRAFRQSSQCAIHIKSHHPETDVPVVSNPNPLMSTAQQYVPHTFLQDKVN